MAEVAQMSTLCYIRKNDKYLMLHRISKKNDVNRDKWIGIGGHFLTGESPEECILREVREETGYTLTDLRFRGVVTFHSGVPAGRPDAENVIEYMFLFTSEQFTGTERACDEGVLEWVPVDRVPTLPIWEGDKIFLKLLADDAPPFLLKLVYDGAGGLREAVLDGRDITNDPRP